MILQLGVKVEGFVVGKGRAFVIIWLAQIPLFPAYYQQVASGVGVFCRGLKGCGRWNEEVLWQSSVDCRSAGVKTQTLS